MRTLSDQVTVGGQLTLEDVPALAALGYTSVICNRPDGEQPGQVSAQEIKAACAEAGLAFHFLPIAGGISADLIAQAGEVVGVASLEKTHMYCASGMRCAALWCCVNAKDRGVETVLKSASQAGYELGHLRPMLTQLSNS